MPNSSIPSRHGALAATIGSQIHFRPGAYRPATAQGQAVIKHELRHIKQQEAGKLPVTSWEHGQPTNQDAILENEAEHAAHNNDWPSHRAMLVTPGAPPEAGVAQFVKMKLATKDSRRYAKRGLFFLEIVNPETVLQLPDETEVEGDFEGSNQFRVKPVTGSAASASLSGAGNLTNTNPLPDEHKQSADTVRLRIPLIGGVPVQAYSVPEMTHVIVQAAYMSGDRNSLAAALHLNPGYGLLLLYDTKTHTAAIDLYNFYGPKLAERVGLCEVGNAQNAYQYLRDVDMNAIHNIPALAGAAGYTVSQGTALVSQNYGDMLTTGYDPYTTLAEAWLNESSLESHELENELLNWLLMDMAMPASKQYALLWVKTGDFAAEKSHHFTSTAALLQLVKLAESLGRIPVLVGDDPEFETTPHLGKFWEDARFRQITGGGDRVAQLRLFRVLAKKYDCVNIGMRSGALEGPALMGMRTVYLEEQGNAQARRMEQWLAVMPNFRRVILDTPPGSRQKAALLTQLKSVRDRLSRPNEAKSAITPQLELLDARVKLLTERAALEELTKDELEWISILLSEDWSTIDYSGRFRFQN